MHVREQLLLEYSHLTDGDSAAGQLCPACKGGGAGEHSLSVSRSGDSLLWKCHRASCGFAGGATSKGNGAVRFTGGSTRTPTTKGVVGRVYYREADKLPPELVAHLVDRYSFSRKQLAHFGWDDDVKRVALPVLNVEGELLGCVLRSENGAQPKALAYVEEDAVAIFRNHSSTDLIIVEDIYSAVRASEYMNAAAILGTHLNDGRIDALKAMKCKRNYLALDADAFNKTIKFVTAFRNSFSMIPVRLTKDLKNHTPDELKEFFNEYT